MLDVALLLILTAWLNYVYVLWNLKRFISSIIITQTGDVNNFKVPFQRIHQNRTLFFPPNFEILNMKVPVKIMDLPVLQFPPINKNY